MTIFKPGDQSDQERVVSSVENQDMQVEISDVLDVQESEKEVAERASAQELGDKIFLQMQGEYQNIIPKEQKEKFLESWKGSFWCII